MTADSLFSLRTVQETDSSLLPDYIRALLDKDGNSRWNADQDAGTQVKVTYSFMQALPSYYSPFADEANNFIPFTNAQKKAARDVLQLWSDVANIKFVEVSDTGDGGQIRFGTARFPYAEAGHAYFPGSSPIAGDVWFNNIDTLFANPRPGDFAFMMMLHETGHAIGLKHPGRYTIGDHAPADPPYLPSFQDNNQYTVMSYHNHPFRSPVFPATPQLFDIAALQHLYGANKKTRDGDDVYSWKSTYPAIATIWDGGGEDTLSAANQRVNAILNLNEGSFSSIGKRWLTTDFPAVENIAIALGVTIENAEGGSGNDIITGNKVDNILQGNAGNDMIDGDSGHDLLDGGTGNDQIHGYTGNDEIFGGAGNDKLTGEYGKDRVEGGDGHDIINGFAGDDILVGDRGNDELVGGGGSDTMQGDAGRDTFTLQAGAGVDQILDFGDRQDKLKLSYGLGFADLIITQQENNTLIRVGKDELAVLIGIRADQITAADFIA
jgi:serralysin